MSESIRQSNLFAAEDYKKVFKAFQFIDYTAYDFDTLKQALINYIQTYYPEDFNDYIESSEFIAIIELLAYFGTSLAFRTDLNSRENFIDTAERRESIVRLAQMVNYIPRRNIAASGLFKIAAVQTNQQLVDANGVAINDVSVFWNDPNNPDWFDQFIQIVNAAFSTLNPFGRPTKSGSIGSIPTDLYQLNNIRRLNVAYPATITVSGQTYPIDIANPDFVTNQTIFERDPDPNNAFNFIYRNDSLGVASKNTGFFLYFKQGNLLNVDTNFEFPVPNRLFPINIQNINQDDVYVQETDQNGNVINKWVKVPALAGENIIYNSIHFAQRNIFSVISGPNNTVSIRFADGNFGNVPTGLFRSWVRVSANQALVIRPDDAQGLQINIPYIGADQQQYVLRLIFNLEQTIGNAAASETDEQIRLRAPEVFSTQSRMVNGSDYNVLPLVYGNQIAKIQSIDRTYSGQSRYIDLNDPTGFHRDLIIFGQDGALYRDNQDVLIEVVKDVSNAGNIDSILLNSIQEILRNPQVTQFFYDEYLPQFEEIIRVNPPNNGAIPGGKSLLDLVPVTPFKITSISGNGTVVTVNYTGMKLAVGAPFTISGVTGVTAYNGNWIVATSPSASQITYNGPGSGAGTVTNAILKTDPSQPLFWKTSPQKYKNDTGFFTTSVASTAAVGLVDTLNSNNVNNGIYQAWGFISPGAVLEFGLAPVAPATEFTNLNSASVQSVIQNGLPLIVDPSNPYSVVGPVELSIEEPLNYQALKVYPVFRNDLTDAEIAEIITRIDAGISFWLYYDLLIDKWGTSITTAPGVPNQAEQPWKYATPNTTPSLQIYSTWQDHPDSGLLYINIATNNDLGTVTYDLIARGRVYVFESYRNVRFYWEPGVIVLDNATGQALRDTIEIMPFVNTNSSIDNNNPVITDPSKAFLEDQVVFDISGIFTQLDGYVDTSKVEVSLVDENEDGIPDNPNGFDEIVGSDDRIIFEFYDNEVTGYQSTRPWIGSWSTTFETTAGDLFVYFPVDLTDNTRLFSAPFISSVELSINSADPVSQYNPPAETTVYLDSADLIFINSVDQLLFSSIDPTLVTIGNQITAFFNNIDTAKNAQVAVEFPWLAGTNTIVDKSNILTTYFIDKSFLISKDNPPGYGVYYSFQSSETDNLSTYATGQLFVAAVDKAHFDKNGKVFTQNTDVLENDRLPLYFKWSHYSPIDQRVDPSPSNIIDMIVVTDGFYRDMIIWKNSNGSIVNIPASPTTEELRIQFQDLDQYKMVSDAMVWNSGTFKILFGPQAATELQATIKVVKSPSTSISDNEIKTKVIQTIDIYFDIRNWDFGEKFFWSELSAFIHQQLSRIISSVVIVPNNANAQFGNLFEIVAGPTELFMSTATVNNVQIVANLTDQNLRV